MLHAIKEKKVKMEAKLPASLNLEGNVAQNWKKFKQQFEIYLVATGKNEKSDEIKIALLLNIIGEEGVEIYNNFTLSDAEKKEYKNTIAEFEKYLTPKISKCTKGLFFIKESK